MKATTRDSFANPIRNQDRFRGSVYDLDAEAIERALRWIRREVDYPYPTSIHLNLTLRCTARCTHCRQWTWPEQSEFSVHQLEKLFRIFNSWGVRTVTFGGGNPLLHPHFSTALELATANHIRVGIISEGNALSSKVADSIGRHAEWIRFSLDGPTAIIHDAIRNAPGLYELVIRSIRLLKARSPRLQIGFNCVVQKGNLSVLPQLVDLGRELGVNVVLFKLPHGDDRHHRFLPSLEEWRSFVEWIKTAAEKPISGVRTNIQELHMLLGTVFRETDAILGRPVRNFYAENAVRCFAPFFFLTCDSAGNVYPCDYLQADTRAWSGRFKAMRQEFVLGNILQDNMAVLNNLADLMRRRVHGLPASGYDECACCTRFCQLNASLTKLDNFLKAQQLSSEAIEAFLTAGKENSGSSAFL